MPEQDHARQDVDDVGAADGRPREQREPGGREQQPRRRAGAGSRSA